jgi:hypothetical protein
LKKYWSPSERGFLDFGEALAKEQVHSNPVTELKRSQNPKRPLPVSFQPEGCSIYENALNSAAGIPSWKSKTPCLRNTIKFENRQSKIAPAFLVRHYLGNFRFVC